MKILYLSGARTADYLCDGLLHGLRTTFGPDVVDIFPLRHMYKGSDQSKTYGKGFTLFGTLDPCEVDRTDIPAKLRNKYFDYIFFGSIQREFSILGEVRNTYGPDQIIFIDGEDNPDIMIDLVGTGQYFKRELYNPHDNVHPIQFGFPEEKIQPMAPKTCLMAPLDPHDTRTYIYEDEATYYASYQSALFGKTMKKAGYDCLRHYEIMGCRTIPWFINLETVPQTIMTKLPKEEFIVAKTMLEYKRGELFLTSAGERIWESLESRIFEKFKANLTTKALAQYVIDTVQKAA